jgi:galactose mutarotase-like enzyme
MKEIKNDVFSIKIKSQGAELTSINGYGHEYLWTSDSNFWNRHAPVLFPIVGSLKDKKYTFNNKVYELNQHGFARDNDFTVIEEGQDYIIYSFKYNDETLKNYPFKFELRIKYQLLFDELKIDYEVFNLDSKDMYFGIGGHPGFNIKNINEYQLLINGSYDRYTLDGAFIDKTLKNQSGNIECSKQFFSNGAFIYIPNNNNDKIITLAYKGHPYIEMTFQDFPIMGVWTPEHGNAPFICLEPWDGIADFKDNMSKNLLDKQHMQKLSIDETKKYSYKIKFYEEK